MLFQRVNLLAKKFFGFLTALVFFKIGHDVGVITRHVAIFYLAYNIGKVFAQFFPVKKLIIQHVHTEFQLLHIHVEYLGHAFFIRCRRQFQTVNVEFILVGGCLGVFCTSAFAHPFLCRLAFQHILRAVNLYE